MKLLETKARHYCSDYSVSAKKVRQIKLSDITIWRTTLKEKKS
jgi:hypothetical protein